MYRQAVAADPDFALAYARLSYLQSYLHWYGVDNSSAVVDDARANAGAGPGLAAGLARSASRDGLCPLLVPSRLRGGVA